MSDDGAKKDTPAGPAPVRAPSRKAAVFLRSTADRVPTKWFVTAAMGVFLAGTALFGGLNTAPEVLPPAVALGDTVEAGGYDVIISEVRIQKSPPPELLSAIEGADKDPAFFVSAVATITNQSDLPLRAKSGVGAVWNRSLGLFGSKSQRTAIAVDGVSTRPGVIIDDDDATFAIFQPLIPTTVTLWWAIPADYDADNVILRIHEYTPAPGEFLAYNYEILWNQGPAIGMFSLPVSEAH